jgi:hypothetical protein
MGYKASCCYAFSYHLALIYTDLLPLWWTWAFLVNPSDKASVIGIFLYVMAHWKDGISDGSWFKQKVG